eukprot:SAG22_NODE_2562_length_2439_cov_1.936752_3_plen_33_part_00
MGALLQPMWQLQCDVIEELLQRAAKRNMKLVD